MSRLFFTLLFIFCALLATAQTVHVNRVIDGDTFVAQDGDTTYHVRMLFVDAPESVHPDKKRNILMGKVASDWMKGCIDGKTVRLEPAPRHEEIDIFNRKLSMVFLNGACVNLELIRVGLSPYYTKYGKAEEPWNTRFQQAEKTARDSSRGIWSDPKLAKQYLKLKSKWGKRTGTGH